MLLNGESITSEDLTLFDVCIVGAGAAGIAMAHKFISGDARYKSKKIIVLDSGIKNVRKGQGRFQTRFYDPLVAPLDYAILDEQCAWLSAAHPDFFTYSRTRAYGGSTNSWRGAVRSLDDYDFAIGKWPLTASELFPYHQSAIKLLGLDYFELMNDPLAWKELVDCQAGAVDVFDAQHLQKFGLKTVIGLRQNSEHYLNFQEHFGEIFERPNSNLTLVHNATAIKFHWPGTRATAARSLECGALNPLDGASVVNLFTVDARQFVLAMGGLEIPRFLLNNSSGNDLLSTLTDIGKFYMNHARYTSAATCHLAAETSSIGPGQQRFYSMEVGLAKDNNATCTAIVVPTEASLIPSSLSFRKTKNFRTHVSFQSDGIAGPWLVNVDLSFEQQPCASSAVTLDGTTDIFGSRRLRLDWQFSAQDAQTVSIALGHPHRQPDGMIYQWLKSLGTLKDWQCVTLRYPYAADLSGGLYQTSHHIGTCRMRPRGAPRDQGVVDGDCKIMGFDNVWIASTAVFPSSGWANSTFTMLALALRLSDRLVDELEQCTSAPQTQAM